jgi:hypothetical protein
MKNKCGFLLIILILASCFACNRHSNSKHFEILPLDSVAKIMADCYFLEGEIHVKQYESNIKDYSLKKYEDFLEQRKITK